MAELLTIDDLLTLRTVSDVHVSPDGRRVAFAVRPSSYPAESAPEGRIWISDDQSQAREITRGPGNHSLPRWSPDGSMLAFASDRDSPGLASLHLFDFTAEARPLGEIAGSVEAIRWASDGRSLVVLVADPGSDRAGGQTATKIEAAGTKPADPLVRRPNEGWRRLFRVEVATGKAAEVGPEHVNIWEFDWQGGDTAVAVVTENPTESAWYDAKVAALDLVARDYAVVHQPEWQVQSVTLARDGSRVAFVEGFGSDRTLLAGTIVTAGLDGSGVARPAGGLQVVTVQWLDDGRLAYLGVAGVQTCFGFVAKDGTVDEAWRGNATLGATHRFAASCDSAGRNWAAAKEAPGEPPELATFDTAGGDWKSLTSLNGHLAGRATSRVNRLAWRSDYDEIEGLLVLPAQEGSGPLPLVVFVHGGPTNTWTYAFSHGYMHLGLLLAENGYAVLLPNPRGSSGRGHEFARANVGDLGGGDLRDILAAVDLLAEQGVIDRARVGITGGSYGGFMSTWAPTQTDAFAAAVAFAVVSDWLSMHNTTNIGRFDELYLGSDPYDATGQYISLSPVVHSRNCRTPMLILHGALDLCCPLGQAQEMYQALVDAGCTTELIVYARGGHGWAEKPYLTDTWQRTKDWFDRYLARTTEAKLQPLEAVAT